MNTEDKMKQAAENMEEMGKRELLSNCCGATSDYYFEISRCPECKENCDYIGEDDELL